MGLPGDCSGQEDTYHDAEPYQKQTGQQLICLMIFLTQFQHPSISNLVGNKSSEEDEILRIRVLHDVCKYHTHTLHHTECLRPNAFVLWELTLRVVAVVLPVDYG